MKHIALILFLIIFLASYAFALEIKLSVSDTTSAEIKYFEYNDSLTIKKFSIEMLNNGSNPYPARALLEIQNESGTTFSGWTQEKVMMPGNNAFFQIYWVPNYSGSFTAKITVFFRGEKISKEFNISVTNQGSQRDNFKILDVKTYRNMIEIDIDGPPDSGDIAVIPENMPKGWIIEQKVIHKYSKKAYIRYGSLIWSREQIVLTIASLDGKYATSKQVRLERERGLLAMFYNMIFGLMD
jgi:hypothetical protein